MKIRKAALAGQWYDAKRNECVFAIESYTRKTDLPLNLGTVIGGIVPHAGWLYSGATAGKTFAAIKSSLTPDTIVLFGAVHRGGIDAPSVDTNDAWETPLGPLEVDAEFRGALVDAESSPVMENDEALRPRENSLEVQMPFVKHLFPGARIVPVGVPPVPSALDAGKLAAEVAKKLNRKVAFIGSSDLTHYGEDYGIMSAGPLPAAKPWMQENDMRLLKLVEQLQADAIVAEATEHWNACGAGAIAATTAAAVAAGANGAQLLQYTTSADVLQGEHPRSAVGYASIVFCRKS